MKPRLVVMVVAVVAVIAVALVVVSNLPPAQWCYRIFDTIAELDKLDSHIIADAEDPYLGDAVPVEHYCKLVSYEGEEYLVAGYVFESLLDTLRFNQCNIWNEKLNPQFDDGTIDPSFWNEGFRSYGTLGRRKLAYYYETSALLIESRTAAAKQFEGFQQWLAESFTVEMPMAEVMAE